MLNWGLRKFCERYRGGLRRAGERRTIRERYRRGAVTGCQRESIEKPSLDVRVEVAKFWRALPRGSGRQWRGARGAKGQRRGVA